MSLVGKYCGRRLRRDKDCQEFVSEVLCQEYRIEAGIAPHVAGDGRLDRVRTLSFRPLLSGGIWGGMSVLWKGMWFLWVARTTWATVFMSDYGSLATVCCIWSKARVYASMS